MPDEQLLWTATRGGTHITCVVTRGCAGVDVQVCDRDTVIRREQHPDSSTAYERARHLRSEFERTGYIVQV